MDIRKIKKLMEMLEDSELTELEINEGEESIRLSKEKAPQLPIDLSKAIQVSNDSIGNNQNITNNTLTTIESTHEELDYGEATKSPMVGTYYSSPDPNSQPYVEVGSKVKVGDTLCVIEAMKIFNQVEAEVDGTIEKVLKDTGDPVEYGEVLFYIQKN